MTPVWDWLALSSLTLAEVLTILQHMANCQMSQVQELGPLSVSFGRNYIKYNHSGPNCKLMAVATHNQ